MANITYLPPLMWSAIMGDVVMTVILYLLLILVNKSVNWIRAQFDFKDMLISVLYGLFLSFYFEVSALYTGRWEYSENMPLFLNTNIGLLPVLQLLILFPVTFNVSRIILIASQNKKILKNR
jgi:phosphate starvation-inducible membrane PsiE